MVLEAASAEAAAPRAIFWRVSSKSSELLTCVAASYNSATVDAYRWIC